MMRTGTLTMIDALGFKGIWGRPDTKNNPDLVVDKLLDLERKLNQMLDLDFGSRASAMQNPGNVLGQCHLVFLSDAVVLGLATKSVEDLANVGIPEESYRGWSLIVAARFANLIMREAAMSTPALAYRGCITYGEFALQRNFIVGRAVDVAAELMDRAQGAFVWMAPDAKQRLDEVKPPPHVLWDSSLVPYSVPLKGGDLYDTYVVSPFDVKGTAAARSDLAEIILSTFTGSIDVEIKKQNTKRFLQHASEMLDAGRPGA